MTRPYILYLDFPDESDNHLRKLAGIRRYAAARGWEVETLLRGKTSRNAVKALCEGDDGRPRPIGCVVESLAAYRDILPPKLFGKVPIVYLDPPGSLPWRGTVAVTCDNAAVAKAAFDELSAGMPPCFATVPSGSALPWTRERISAFAALCTADGRELHVFRNRHEEKQHSRIARLSKWLAALPRRSAVFAANDAIALEVVEAAGAIPRHIPKELTVIGVDGEPSAEDRETFHAAGAQLGLSSVKLDFELAGYKAAKMLGEMVSRGGVETRRTMRHGDVTTDNTTMSRSRSADKSFSFSFGPLCILRRESTRGAGRRDPSVLEAVETIRREACDGLTAAALAEAFPGSRKHFERRFREAMGHSVLDEILHVRLEKAQTLLLRRDVPIRDIADLCGFRTGIELRKLFRLRFGVSMRQWRREHAPESGEED